MSGKGIGAEAVRAAAEFGLTHLAFARVQCSIAVDDDLRGKELLEAGFTREGRLRCWWHDDARKQWTDEVMFSMVKSDLG
ncbi:MAG TPA: GNAT family protein [Planctomycetota bacterium]|nr:GNAT family protein [Planctomycetota bacterium]